MYPRKNKWAEQDIIDAVTFVMNTLGIDYLPTHSQINAVTGTTSLTNALARHGGSQYFAERLGVECAPSSTQTGFVCEDYAIDDIKQHTGFDSEHMPPRYPYDILVGKRIKVDVKMSRQLFPKDRAYPANSFGLGKKSPTCDIFVLYCIGDNRQINKTLIIPSCLAYGQSQIGVGSLSKWDAYTERWDYFAKYMDFYTSIQSTAVHLPKRRSTGR